MAVLETNRVLVVGSGSIGRRHMRNLHGLGFQAIATCDPDPERSQPMVDELGVTAFTDFESALQAHQPQIVFICTPPVLHIEQARRAVEAGAHVFLEKPVSHSLDGVDALDEMARAAQRVVQVGYNFRFHPGLRALKHLLDEGRIGRLLWTHVEVGKYLPDWRKWQDYRQSYTARRELGGGIILDYSHELNYAQWLMGYPSAVFCEAGRRSDLDVNVEDHAVIMLRFANGAHAAVHMDFVQRKPVRVCKLVGANGTLLWDVAANHICLYTDDTPEPVLDEKLVVDHNRSYIDEVQHFLSAIQNAHAPEVSLSEGCQTLKVALAAHESAASGQWVDLRAR